MTTPEASWSPSVPDLTHHYRYELNAYCASCGDPVEDQDLAEPGPALDLVNHPPHYTSHPSGVECIEVVEHLNFCVGNAVKYLWRAGLKDGAEALEDLEKAAWYVAREIGRRRELDLQASEVSPC